MSGAYLGDFTTSNTIYVPFNTFDSNDPSASVTLTGLALGDIKIYKNGSVTQRSSTAGFSLLDTDGIDFDGITGVHGFSVDLSDNTDAGFYVAGSEYWIVVDAVTVDAGVISFVAALFSIERAGGALALLKGTNSLANIEDKIDIIDTNVDSVLVDTAEIGTAGAGLTDLGGMSTTMKGEVNTEADTAASDYGALKPTTAGRTLDVTVGGTAGIDWANVENPTTALDLSGTDIQLVDTTTTNSDMRGTDNAALASVLGALADAAAAGDPTSADTLMQYVKQLINILVGTTGVTTFPAEAAPANNVSLAEVVRAIHADVTGLAGSAMRGTDNAALASVATEARLAELDAANLPSTTDDILTDTAVIGALGAGLTDITDRLPAALTKGTADSGTTLTMVDAARTEADTDYWKGAWIRFTSGTVSGQVRLITGFTPGTDTVTFAPATTQAVATNTYEIIPAANVDIRQWLGATVNALVSGAVDADVSAMQASVLTAAAIATGAVDADALATDAVNEIRDAILSDGTAFAGANIDAAVSSRATPAQVNTEVADVLKTDTITLPGQTAPPLTPTFEEAIAWVYKVLRNRKRQTATTWELLDDAETTVDAKATVSDDGTTAIKQEIVSGP